MLKNTDVIITSERGYDQNRLMVNHSALCRSIKYDYMNILTETILKKTQILNGCETFAFKYKMYDIACDNAMTSVKLNQGYKLVC